MILQYIQYICIYNDASLYFGFAKSHHTSLSHRRETFIFQRIVKMKQEKISLCILNYYTKRKLF